MTDYCPINCDLHDELEVAATHRQPIMLHWTEPPGEMRSATGVVRDIEVGNGEEFLVFDVAGEHLRIRLDWINWRRFPMKKA